MVRANVRLPVFASHPPLPLRACEAMLCPMFGALYLCPTIGAFALACSGSALLRACLRRISTLSIRTHLLSCFAPFRFACLLLTARNTSATFRCLAFRTYACCLRLPIVVVLLAVCVARRALSPARARRARYFPSSIDRVQQY